MIKDKYAFFEEMTNKLVNSQSSGIATLFSFAFMKVYLR